jgi:hypothetical protein
VSEVQTKPASFFDLFAAGRVSLPEFADFVSDWHNTGEEEQRPLSEYLGFTDAEFDVWALDRRLLPNLVAARRSGQPLAAVVADHVQRLKAKPAAADRAALFSLGNWLKARGIDA